MLFGIYILSQTANQRGGMGAIPLAAPLKIVGASRMATNTGSPPGSAQLPSLDDLPYEVEQEELFSGAEAIKWGRLPAIQLGNKVVTSIVVSWSKFQQTAVSVEDLKTASDLPTDNLLVSRGGKSARVSVELGVSVRLVLSSQSGTPQPQITTVRSLLSLIRRKPLTYRAQFSALGVTPLASSLLLATDESMSITSSKDLSAALEKFVTLRSTVRELPWSQIEPVVIGYRPGV